MVGGSGIPDGNDLLISLIWGLFLLIGGGFIINIIMLILGSLWYIY